MLEKTIEKKCGEVAKSRSCLWLKWSSPSQRGVPDRVLIGVDLILFIELKRPGGKLTPLQKAMHARIDKAYDRKVCHTVSSVEELEAILDDAHQ